MNPAADPVLDWLLEETDPGVRFLAMRDLLDVEADDPALHAARRETLHKSPVMDILEAQEPEGYWVEAGPGYLPKYRSTLWQVIYLGQFGADGNDERIKAAGNYVLASARSPHGGFSMNGARSGMIHCLQGNLCSSLIELSFKGDPRLQEALEWLARSILGEGIATSSEKNASVRYLRSGNTWD